MTVRVTRAQLGWPASEAPLQAATKGCKIHYLGSSFVALTHQDCVAEVKRVRVAHLNHPTENYSDIAYSEAVCRHGVRFECRGYGKRTGANGTQELNKGHYAILCLLGNKGDMKPTAEMIAGVRDAVRSYRLNGAGKEIKGHRDGHATACPGDALYALVKLGEFEPKVVTDASPIPKPKPVYAPYPGPKYFFVGRTSKLVTELGKALVKTGYKGYKVGPGPVFSPADRKAVKWFQQKQGWAGKDADGIPGKETWARLKVSPPK